MKKQFIHLLIMHILTAPAGLYAQTPASAGSMPFVSQIKAESSNNLIKLTWVDAPAAQGTVYIFRSPRPFSGTIPPNSRPIPVPYGTQEYIDDIDTLDIIHYFIAASNTEDQRFDNIIPNVNNISVYLGQTVPLEESPPAVITAVTESLQGISNLTAKPENDKIIITFDSGVSKNAVLYRSTLPVRHLDDLLSSVVVHSGTDTVVTDHPAAGRPWYYAAVYEDELVSGSVRIAPNSNATTAAVVISGLEETQEKIRSIPLPYMTVLNAVPDSDVFWEIPDRLPLKEEAAKALEDTHLPLKAPLVLKKPRVFIVDQRPPSIGEESALIFIVQEHFEKREWDNARIGLLQYLSRPGPQDVEVRARFYLGQTLYFTGNYRQALFEFLTIKSYYPVEVNLWIDAVLAAMVY